MGEEDANESCGEDIKPVCKESTVPTEYIGEFLLFFITSCSYLSSADKHLSRWLAGTLARGSGLLTIYIRQYDTYLLQFK